MNEFIWSIKHGAHGDFAFLFTFLFIIHSWIGAYGEWWLVNIASTLIHGRLVGSESYQISFAFIYFFLFMVLMSRFWIVGFFYFFLIIKVLWYICTKLEFWNLQDNRREGRNVQNSILWNMSLWSSHGQKWMGHVYLPTSSWVDFPWL